MAGQEQVEQRQIYLSPPWLGGGELRWVERAFESGYIAPCGPMVDEFEREFARVVGGGYACAVASGTAGLDLLFHEAGVGAGDRVFCSDLTFVSSIAPAVQRGAEPVFIDCDAKSWTMDVGLLERALGEAESEGWLPKVVVAVDLYGQRCDYERIVEVCARYGVGLIIDAAESVGSGGSSKVLEFLSSGVGMDRGRLTGCVNASGDGSPYLAGSCGGNGVPPSSRGPSRGVLGVVYSFNGNKIITTSGGGMVVSGDAGVVERARKRSQQAREPVVWYEHEELGYNYRMSNIVAAVGLGQLEVLEQIVAKKREIFEWYQEELEGERWFEWMPEAEYGRCTRWLTVGVVRGGVDNGELMIDNRGPSGRVMRFVEALKREGIEARPVWKPMHLQPVFRGAKVYGGGVSERLFRDGICLPSGAGLERGDVVRICGVIRNCLMGNNLV